MKTKFSAYLNSNLPPYRYEVLSDEVYWEGALLDILKAVGSGLIDCYEWEVTSYDKNYDAAVDIELSIGAEIKRRKGL